jgi:RHS repeat-associated protein
MSSTTPELSLDTGHEPQEELLKFTAHERDLLSGSGQYTLDYMHARYFMSAAGRFLSVDPSMDLKKTIRNPQEWNRYAYVENNPIRYTDPDGRETYVITTFDYGIALILPCSSHAMEKMFFSIRRARMYHHV